MITHDFSIDSIYQRAKQSFLPLGSKFQELDDYNLSQFSKKIDSQFFDKLDFCWGTLGWMNNKRFSLTGNIDYSENGNESSNGVTKKEIESIWQFNPLAGQEGFKVIERFINFDQVNFNIDKNLFHFDDIPKLRLTLFVNPDEGALVYYQHGDKVNFIDNDGFIEYILPKKTENYDTKRDRLHYEIPILPTHQIVHNDLNKKRRLSLGSKERNTSFIIKVLTFKRNEGEASKLLSEATSTLNKLTKSKEKALGKAVYHLFGKEKYKLLWYDRNLKEFTETKGDQLDSSKKTLLLIHGTFSSTNGSYGRLYDKAFKRSGLIDKLIDVGVFEQVIAFDHPTISHGVKDNAKELYAQLMNIRFTKSVDILSYSRGALLSKFLSADPSNNYFRTGKVLTFSGANGVGYFTLGSYVSKGLSVWKKTSSEPVGKIISAIAQFSVDFFLEQPGCLVMTPKKKELTVILDAKPRYPNTTYKAVVADWEKSLVDDKWWKKLTSMGLDAIIKLILGSKHDWVVGAREQGITPKGQSKPKKNISSIHTKNFNLEYVKPQHNTHHIIYNFFKE